MRNIRHAYGPKQRQQIHFPEQGRTKQAMQAECDINNIMAKFQKTGVIDFVNKHSPQFGDATGIEFQDAMEKVAKSREMFAELPSKVRKRFDNDPAQFLDFVNDPENEAEARVLGLTKDRRKEKPVVTGRRDGDPKAPVEPKKPDSDK